MKSFLQSLLMYRAKFFNEALDKAEKLVALGGWADTSVLYTDQVRSKDRIAKFSQRMKTGRTIINMPSSQGAIGDLYKLLFSSFADTRLWKLGETLELRKRRSETSPLTSRVSLRGEKICFGLECLRGRYFKYGCLDQALDELKE